MGALSKSVARGPPQPICLLLSPISRASVTAFGCISVKLKGFGAGRRVGIMCVPQPSARNASLAKHCLLRVRESHGGERANHVGVKMFWMTLLVTACPLLSTACNGRAQVVRHTTATSRDASLLFRQHVGVLSHHVAGERGKAHGGRVVQISELRRPASVGTGLRVRAPKVLPSLPTYHAKHTVGTALILVRNRNAGTSKRLRTRLRRARPQPRRTAWRHHVHDPSQWCALGCL